MVKNSTCKIRIPTLEGFSMKHKMIDNKIAPPMLKLITCAVDAAYIVRI